VIREITINELPELIPFASQFYSCSKFLSEFNPEVWLKNWTLLLQNKIGVIFGLFDENGKCHGGLGALKVPDLNGGFLIASEAFWFTEKSYRGKGIYLLKEYEKWAKNNKCKRISMGYLVDSMPERIKAIYEKFGYELSEITYIKDII